MLDAVRPEVGTIAFLTFYRTVIDLVMISTATDFW